MKVLCDAVAFGFGPIGKLLAIRSFLPSDWEFTLLGSGTSLALADKSGFDRIVACDTNDRNELISKSAEFHRADLFVNIMNPVSAGYAAQLGVPMAEVDSLFWMWHEIPQEYIAAERYFVQNFIGVADRLDTLAGGSASVVGPIVRGGQASDNRRLNQLIIGLGGMRSILAPSADRLSYPKIIAYLLRSALKEHSFERVLIAGDLESLRTADWQIPHSTYALLSHEEFLSELGRSSFALLSPGLTASYEAFAAAVPVIFLLPQNLSQWFILRRLRSAGVAPFSLHWQDFFPEVEVSLSSDEASGVEKIFSVMARFEDIRAEAEDRLRESIRHACSTDGTDIQVSQAKFLASMGQNGASAIASQIIDGFSPRSRRVGQR